MQAFSILNYYTLCVYIIQKKKNKSKHIALAVTPSSDSDSDNDVLATITSSSQQTTLHASDALNPKITAVETKSGPKKGKTTKRIEKQETIELELRAQVCFTLYCTGIYLHKCLLVYLDASRIYCSTSAIL